MQIRTLLFILLSIYGSSKIKLSAQPQHTHAANMLHKIKSLQTCGSILYIAAHPDDENTRLISWLVNDQHLRTGYLSLTRGDGGQNLIGEEQSEQLGLIRTHELLQARKIDGGQQFFTRAYDFGYSKTSEETLQLWNRDSVLSDMVWVIRTFQPDIIICRFPVTGEGGHGHHTASAILAEEAYEAAANPEMFKEQLVYAQIWQAQRLLWNTYSFGNRNTTAPDQFSINAGTYNSLLGKSYGEIAAESRSSHSSQAFGTARNRSAIPEYFKTLKGNAPVHHLLDGIQQDWNRFEGGNKLQTQILNLNTPESILKWMESPYKLCTELLQLHKSIQANTHLPDIWKSYALNKTEQLILYSIGWYAEATSPKAFVCTGDSLPLTLQITQRNPELKIKLNSIQLQDYYWQADSNISSTQTFSHIFKLKLKNKNISQPFWLKNPREGNMFASTEILNTGKAVDEAALQTEVQISIEDYILKIKIPVLNKTLNPSIGEVYQPLYISPPASLNFLRETYIFPDSKAQIIQLKVRAFRSEIHGNIQLIIPEFWKCVPEFQSIDLAQEGEEKIIEFELFPPSGAQLDQILKLQAQIKINQEIWTCSFQPIQYPHIPDLVLFNTAECKITNVKLNHTFKRVGYITGAGDKIPEMLRACGIEVIEIQSEDILQNKLSQYDAILTGIRAWNTEKKLNTWQSLLMQYVEQGGTLVVQYNTSQSQVTPNIGPYPLKLSRERVTDENSPVRFIDPENVLLNYPNKITLKDFETWVQERGLYFPGETDPAYQKVLAISDPGETENENSIIYADYGKGRFVYTGLSFFRQLPAGVPGAYKLMINLMSRRE